MVIPPENKIVRLLASPHQQTRHDTIQKLSAYLKTRCDVLNSNEGISKLNLMKLWKGLWHTLYLCDKSTVQEELCDQLSNLMWCFEGTEEEDVYAGRLYLEVRGRMKEMEDVSNNLSHDCSSNKGVFKDDKKSVVDIGGLDNESDRRAKVRDLSTSLFEYVDNEEEDSSVKHCRGAHLVSLYIQTFFYTVRREWVNVDKYRLDKLYTAIRQMIYQAYKYMAARNWNTGIVQLFNDSMYNEVLSHKPNGIRYHLIDIALDELARVNMDASISLTEETLLNCLEPYFDLVRMDEDKTVHLRVVESIFLRFLTDYSIVGNHVFHKDYHQDQKHDDDSIEETQNLIMDQVHVGAVAKFILDAASDSKTLDKYRSDLYNLYKTFVRRIKKVGNDVLIDVYEGEDALKHKKRFSKGVLNGINKNSANGCNRNNCDVMHVEGFVPGSTEESVVSKGHDSSSIKHLNNKVILPTTIKNKHFIQPRKQQKNRTKRKIGESINNLLVEEQVLLPHSPDKDNTVNDDYLSEDIIVITNMEQETALKAMAVNNARKAASTLFPSSVTYTNDNKKHKVAVTTPSSYKRVKFGMFNMSKSYKASMKDLRNVNPKETLERTPEKSILLSNNKHKTKS